MNGFPDPNTSTARKTCTRWTVAIIGIIYMALAIFSFYLSVESNYTAELILLGIHKTMAYTLIATGCGFFLSAALGWVAASSKNECLAFGFGYLSLVTFLIFTALGVTIFIEKA